MSFVSGLERRDAVYYWRRRLPALIARKAGINQLKISLQTREFRPARFLAAQLDATAESWFVSQNTGITKDQLAQLFRKAFEEHREKLATIAAFSREEADYNPWSDIHDETVMGWAYRVRSSNGHTAAMTSANRDEMVEAGIEPSIIADVECLLSHWKETGDGDPSHTRLTDMLIDLDVLPSASNRARATPAYLRAIGEALLTTDQRYNADPLPFKDLMTDTMRFSPEIPVSAEQVSETEAVAPQSTPIVPDIEAASSITDAPSTSRVAAAGPRDVGTIGKRLIDQNFRDKTWESKTARQAAATFDLLQRYLVEDHQLRDLGDLRQDHLDGFAELLR